MGESKAMEQVGIHNTEELLATGNVEHFILMNLILFNTGARQICLLCCDV